jgi:HEAT repeat protein
MGLAEAAPELRRLAESPQTDISLRTVAIAGLGQLKDEKSRPLLAKLGGSPVPRSGDTINSDHVPARIRQAAQMALKRLDAARSGQPAKAEAKARDEDRR